MSLISSVQQYLGQYPLNVQQQVQALLDEQRLASFLLQKHPVQHDIYGDAELREYVMSLKRQYLRKSQPLSKVIYDDKLHIVRHALGTHTCVSRVQGRKTKSKNELRVSSLFKRVSGSLLKMIVVHELAHLREREHNKAFYRLCTYMLPDYHQLEFEMRVYLVQLDESGPLY